MCRSIQRKVKSFSKRILTSWIVAEETRDTWQHIPSLYLGAQVALHQVLPQPRLYWESFRSFPFAEIKICIQFLIKSSHYLVPRHWSNNTYYTRHVGGTMDYIMVVPTYYLHTLKCTNT